MIFFEHKNEFFLQKYDEIINYLINSNFINFNTEIIFPSSIHDFYEQLNKYFPSDNLLMEKISEYFNLPIFEDNCSYSINDLGVCSNDTFYFLDIFSQKSFMLYNKYSKYGLIKNYGIISKEIYEKLIKSNKKTNEELSFMIDNIIQRAILTNTSEFFISFNGSILFKTNANSYYIEDKILLPSNFDFNKLFFNYNNEEYSVIVEKISINDTISFNFKIITKDSYSFSGKKMRHYDKLQNYILENKGIILLSSKNNNNLYYDTLNKLSKLHKKIISFDNKNDFNINNVLTYSNSFFNDNNIDLSNYDIIFINDIDLYSKVFLKSVELGKLVIVFINNKDCLSSILNVLKKTTINKYIFSENFLCSLHYSEMPHLCDDCKIQKNKKEISLFNENMYSMYNYGIGKNPIYINNKKGCNSCIKGYSKTVYISEILENDNDISDNIEQNFNIRQLRNFIKSKRWEGEEENSLYLLKKGIISIEDIKRYS